MPFPKPTPQRPPAHNLTVQDVESAAVDEDAKPATIAAAAAVDAVLGHDDVIVGHQVARPAWATAM